jgi:hypothetical protein
MSDLIFLPEEASQGAYNSVRKIEGDIFSITRVPSSFEDGADRVELKMKNVNILEMADGEPEPELEDGRYTLYMKYAKPGKKPHKNSPYIRGFCESAKKLGLDLSKINDTSPLHAILAREDINLGFNDKETKEPVTAEGWVFSDGSNTPEVGIEDYIAKLIDGQTKAGARRQLALDNKAKKYPEFREAIEDESIVNLAPVEYDAATGMFKVV